MIPIRDTVQAQRFPVVNTILISVDEAREMGLPVGVTMPEEVYQLMTLYPQARQQRPSVSYIPTPYQQPERRSNK